MDPQRESYIPNELWSLIFNFGDQRDFTAISLACKRLHELVKPHLYREFNWVPDVDYPLPSIEKMVERKMLKRRHKKFVGSHLLGSAPSSSPQKHLRPISKIQQRKMVHCLPGRKKKVSKSRSFGPAPYLLLRTLLRHPALARHVKHVKILAVSEDIGLFWNEYEARQDGLTVIELSRCFKAADKTLPVSGYFWKKWLRQGRLDVIIGILLSMLPNLSSAELRVRYKDTTGHNVVFRGLCSKRYSDGVLIKNPSIKSVTVSLDDEAERRWPNTELMFDDYDMDGQVFWLLQFPQLEHLSVPQLHDGMMDFMLIKREIKLFDYDFSKNLKQLKLSQSVVSEDGLNALLHVTPHLEDFECDLRYRCGGPEFCRGEKLNAALSKVSGTLRRLKLNFEVIQGYSRHGIVVETPMRSMKHFKQLSHLDIPLILITPKFGAVSSSTFEEVLPNQIDILMMRPYPTIIDHDRREMACRALSEYVASRPWLDGDRSERLVPSTK